MRKLFGRREIREGGNIRREGEFLVHRGDEGEEPTVTVTTAMPQGAPPKPKGTVEEAVAFLEKLLSDGPMASAEVEERATKAGISKSTLKRARKAARVEARKDGHGGWFLALPQGPEQDEPEGDEHSLTVQVVPQEEQDTAQETQAGGDTGEEPAQLEAQQAPSPSTDDAPDEQEEHKRKDRLSAILSQAPTVDETGAGLRAFDVTTGGMISAEEHRNRKLSELERASERQQLEGMAFKIRAQEGHVELEEMRLRNQLADLARQRENLRLQREEYERLAAKYPDVAETQEAQP